MFKTLLSQSNIQVNLRVLRTLENDKGFKDEAKLCSTPQDAARLYLKVANALSTNARAELVQTVFDNDKFIVTIDERVEVSPYYSVSIS